MSMVWRRSIKAVGLDVDGVLRDTGYDAYRALCATIEELGGTVPTFEDLVRHYVSNFEVFFRARGVTCGEARIVEVYRRHLIPHEHCAPFPDVEPTMLALHRLGLPLFVVSGHPQEEVIAWLVEHDLNEHFHSVRGGSRDKVACIRAACTDLAVDPSSVAYVGDWGLDIRAAMRVGALPIGITRGYESRAALHACGADHIVEHLDEVLTLLNADGRSC